MESTLELLRPLVVASKDGISLRSLARDYRDLICEDIPFVKFGFNSLYAFLENARHIFYFEQRDGEIIVKVRLGSDIRHIQDLISKQKAKPKRKPMRMNAWQPTYGQRPAPVYRQNFRTIHTGNVVPRNNISSSMRHFPRTEKLTLPTLQRTNWPISSVPSSTILLRVSELIKSIKQGIPEKRVEFEYQEKYRESLANGWRKKLEDYQNLSGTYKFESFESLPGVWALKPAEGRPLTNRQQDSQKQVDIPNKNGMSKLTMNGPTPSMTSTSRLTPSQIEEMRFIKEPSVDVLVTSVQSPALIWIRLHSDKTRYEELATKMISFYAKNKVEVPSFSLKKNDFMAGKIGNIWFRVKLCSMTPSGNCIVQAVDTGKLVQIKPSDLQPLAPVFRNVQPFAMKAQISGLKSSTWNREKLEALESRLLGHMFVCYLFTLQRDHESNIINVVTFKDTRGEVDVDPVADLGL